MNKKLLIGRRMKELRKRKGLSQEELAERADTSPNYVSRMERGTENPTLDMLIKLEIALGVELWEIFDYGHKSTAKDLRDILGKLTHEIHDEGQLETAVRLLRALTR